MNAWLSGLLGVVMGAGGLYAWHRQSGPDPELVAARQRIAALSSERADEAAELAQTRAQVAQLGILNQNLTQQIRDKVASVAPTVSAVAPTLPIAPPPMPPEMRVFHERRLRGEADRLKRRLQLSEPQAQQLDRLVTNALSTQENGPPVFELATNASFKKELEKLLTPTQKTSFDALEQKERQSRAEIEARFELSQVERAVDMSEDQRQAVLQKLLERARARNAEGPTEPPDQAVDPDPMARMQARFEQQVAAMEGILTAPQLEEYRRHLTADLEGMTAVMKASPNVAPPL